MAPELLPQSDSRSAQCQAFRSERSRAGFEALRRTLEDPHRLFDVVRFVGNVTRNGRLISDRSVSLVLTRCDFGVAVLTVSDDRGNVCELQFEA